MRTLWISLILASAIRADVVVYTLDGKLLRGISLAADADSVSLHSAEGPIVAVKTDQVVEIANLPQPAVPPPNAWPFEVLLTDGTRIRGQITEGQPDALRLASPLLRETVGPLDIELERILSIRRVGGEKIEGTALIAPVRNDDAAYTLTGARTQGTVERFTAKGVVIARQPSPRMIPYEELAAVFIDNQALPPLQGLHAVVRLADGGAIVLTKNFRVAMGELTGQTPSGISIRVKTAHVAAIGFMGGSFVHLSDLAPKVSRTPFFPVPEGPAQAAMLDFVCPVRIDKSPDGNPITLDKRRYFKGIGVRPRTELTFDIKGDYRVFQTLCGIDDEVFGPDYGRGAGAGSVVFEIYGDDDKRLFRSDPVIGGTKPLAVRIDVTGVRTLRLVVTLVPKEQMPKGRADSPELDNAVWARPLLIR